MSVVFQILVATALIAALIVLRVISSRQAMRQRLARDGGEGNCADAECFGGCGRQGSTESECGADTLN